MMTFPIRYSFNRFDEIRGLQLSSIGKMDDSYKKDLVNRIVKKEENKDGKY